jgi:small subunit ribosomal protein S2
MSVVSMRELLEAGVHFGHQTRRWNPKMRRFIFTERGGIYIIDLQQTLSLLEQAHAFVRNIAERGGSILFVGTKKQAQDAVAEHANRVSMPFVNHRWLGGLLTNWRTMSERIERLHELRRLQDDGSLEKLPSKERLDMLSELEKLETNLGGVADMKRLPDAVVLVDLRKEQLAVREARRLGIPVIGLVDTNCDPDDADFVIPGNDDAIRACSLIVRVIADGVAAGGRRIDISELTGENGQAQAAPEGAAEAAPAVEEEAAPAGPEPAAEAAAEPEPAAEAAAGPEPAVEAPAEPEHAPEPPAEPEPAAEAAAPDAAEEPPGEAAAAAAAPDAADEPAAGERGAPAETTAEER